MTKQLARFAGAGAGLMAETPRRLPPSGARIVADDEVYRHASKCHANVELMIENTAMSARDFDQLRADLAALRDVVQIQSLRIAVLERAARRAGQTAYDDLAEMMVGERTAWIGMGAGAEADANL